MRQCYVVRKKFDEDPVKLDPEEHKDLLNTVPILRDSLAFVKDNPSVEFVGIRIGTVNYSIVVTERTELQPSSMEL